MNRFSIWVAIVAGGTALLTGQAHTQPPTPFKPQSFGFNLSQSLINPLEPGSSEDALRIEVAAILYDVRMAGGQVVRWIVTDVWPQWRCGLDPEDQRTGAIDPAWYIVSRILLEEAARQNVTVVVSLAYLSNGGFAATSADPAQVMDAAQRMAAHRRETAGLDHYGLEAARSCIGTPGYYGHIDQAALFTDPSLRQHLRQRYARMARYLASFPSLGAIELFNEPDFALTATPTYWELVLDLRHAIQGASFQAARVPVISGTAAWSQAIVDAAQKAGAMTEEPFITVHAYDDYTTPRKDPAASLRGLLTYIRKLAPNKPVVLSEIGGSTSIKTLPQYQIMLNVIMDLYLNSDAGVWVWGNWFKQPETTDYALDFNHRSAVGPAFRPYFFDARETEYAKPLSVCGTDHLTSASSCMTLAIGRGTMNVEPLPAGNWTLVIDGSRLLGFSSAGVFSEPFKESGRFADPPPTLFLAARGERLRWASVSHVTNGWELKMFECMFDLGVGAANASLTPNELLGLAADQHREDVRACKWSRLRFSAKI